MKNKDYKTEHIKGLYQVLVAVIGIIGAVSIWFLNNKSEGNQKDVVSIEVETPQTQKKNQARNESVQATFVLGRIINEESGVGIDSAFLIVNNKKIHADSTGLFRLPITFGKDRKVLVRAVRNGYQDGIIYIDKREKGDFIKIEMLEK